MESNHSSQGDFKKPSTNPKGKGREFPTIEEMFRYDSMQIALPPTLQARLFNSIQIKPKRKAIWWKRLFSS